MGIRAHLQGWSTALPALMLPSLSYAQEGTNTGTDSLVIIIYLVTLFLALIVGLFILFIPAIIAFRRQHPNRWAIAVICLAFGGTIIGWFGAMVWALQVVHKSETGSDGGESGLNIFINDPVAVRVEPSPHKTPSSSPPDQIVERLARLHTLLQQGAISEDEHSALRKAALSEWMR